MVSPRLLESALHLTDVVVHFADAIDRHARAENDAALVTKLGDPGDHRNRPVRRHPGRVDAELAQTREPIEHHTADLDHVVAGGRLAAREVRDLDVLPQRRGKGAVDLLERHVGLAVAALPVAAHLAPRVADERAVKNQDSRMDGFVGCDVRIDEVAGSAGRRFQQVFRGVGLCHEPLDLTLVKPCRKGAGILPAG